MGFYSKPGYSLAVLAACAAAKRNAKPPLTFGALENEVLENKCWKVKARMRTTQNIVA